MIVDIRHEVKFFFEFMNKKTHSDKKKVFKKSGQKKSNRAKKPQSEKKKPIGKKSQSTKKNLNRQKK